MIYFAISNVGLAIMMIVVYVRYSKLAITSSHKIRNMKKTLDREIAEKKKLEEQLEIATQSDSERVAMALKEVDELRKEKEYELKLRLEAEKQIALAMQKTDDIQKRMQDWRVIQDAVMKDYKEEIVNMGDAICQKVSDNYHAQAEQNNQLLQSIAQHVKAPSTPKAKAAKNKTNTPAIEDAASLALMEETVGMMAASGHVMRKDYFTIQAFGAKQAEFFLCDIAFIVKDVLHIIDFKAGAYFEAYLQDKNAAALKKKLQQYLDYVVSEKYITSINTALSFSDVAFERNKIVMALPSDKAMQLMEKSGFYDKASDLGILVAGPDKLNDIIL